MPTLAESYAFCRRVARKRARNFYYSFVLLSRPQRDAMCAVYAFMRHCDDLSDEPGASREPLERWRSSLEDALEGRFDDHPVWPALRDTIHRYHIPPDYLRQMIAGVMSDLQPKRLQTFSELYHYCYQVASVVGMTAVHIFGFDSSGALLLAEKCGVAFQLTNILRDIREDAERGRIYLPMEDLHRFGVMPEDLRAGRPSGSFISLMRFEAARARSYYQESMPLLKLVHVRSRRALWALIEIYSRLLRRIEKVNYDVLSARVSLPAVEKLSVILRAWGRSPARSD